MEDLLQLRRRHRQIDPIEVIDEDAEAEQDPNLPPQMGDMGRGPHGARWTKMPEKARR